MSIEHNDDDKILDRLRSEDPAKESEVAASERPGEREAIRQRAMRLAQDGRSPASGRGRCAHPRRLAVGVSAALVGLAGGAALILLGGGSGSPAPALAIERTDRWVTLKIEDPTASDEQMNDELAAAGIDRIRVLALPGSPKDVGTWAGFVDVAPICQGGASRFGSYGVDIPVVKEYTRGPEDNRDLIDAAFPLGTGVLTVGDIGTPYSGDTLRLETDTVDDPKYAAKVLVPIRAEAEDDTEWSNVIGPEQLIALGGVFAEYGHAVEDGEATCEEFELSEHPDLPTPGDHASGRLVFPAAGCVREIAPSDAGKQLKDIPEPIKDDLRQCSREVLGQDG
jgi:hypothetical protein